MARVIGQPQGAVCSATVDGWKLSLVVRLLVPVFAVGVLLVSTAASAGTPNPPHGHWSARPGGPPILVCDLTYYAVGGEECRQVLAFRSRAEPADRLPDVVVDLTSRALASRHVETARDPTGHVWNLFLAIEDRSLDPSRDPCLEVVRNGLYWGGLCVPGTDLVAPGAGARWNIGDRVLLGIAGNSVGHVRVLDAQRHRRPVSLTADHSFIYFCASDCGCEVSAVVMVSNAHAAVTELPVSGAAAWCVSAQVRALFKDWYADRRIDGTYDCAVIQEAIRRLPSTPPIGSTVKQDFAAYEENVC